ncbi:hypothetical protein CARUB_v10011020mg [Capsella rubella]|uniref:Phospho-2-dehydro-3-deoxyheptonate aldolase n=1 Tax=Capsella rubella TaxID=81985 RepID=R0GS61_9BRAS|nr:hypothetical protein CARUB_v10011020mg [Capsella rubella]
MMVIATTVGHVTLQGAEGFLFNSVLLYRYQELANRVDEALGFMSACGLGTDHPLMTTTDFYTYHELDSTSGLYYDCSAHMVWCGERIRQLDGAHVEFLKGIANPLGIKVSNKMDPSELVKLVEILISNNKPGRITIIVRMGAENMRVQLPHLSRAVRRSSQIVTWVCDTMNGNTIKVPCGLKTRAFEPKEPTFLVFGAEYEWWSEPIGRIFKGFRFAIRFGSVCYNPSVIRFLFYTTLSSSSSVRFCILQK